MKNLTVRLKITLWFSALIIIMVGITFTLMLVISDSVLNTDAKDSLKSVININTQEIEFIDDLTEEEQEVGDQYIVYKDGYLEIDDDFLNESYGVYTALYDSEGNLLYGQNPIKAPLTAAGKISEVKYNGEKYYTLCTELSGDMLDGLILQGTINENANKTVLTRIVNLSLFVLPVLALFAIIVGYLLAGRFLSPIRKIASSAESISDSNDLSKRIEAGSKDELGQLADAFNKMFARLEKSFEEERQFTSDISHELRTPVATILAQCELTLEKERTADEYKKALNVINRQSTRMKNIVEQMLQYSRLERLEGLTDAQDVDLSQLCKDIAEEQKVININSITTESDIDDGIIIKGRADLLTRLINNLISNAFRYGRENGHILLSLKETENEIVLSVKDDGIGISPDEQENIFNRFYQADKSRSANGADLGIGLGLSIAAAVAQLHGGHMHVDSELGVGSTFSFIIPKKQ
ncbi:MAG: HAMP domain-containing histidine kinase [Clostridiales bacterium]|nr:HAMP domain-containing histidine kinase [Clostridiales bacterium]